MTLFTRCNKVHRFMTYKAEIYLVGANAADYISDCIIQIRKIALKALEGRLR
jgi:hypothetical protein